MNAISLTTRIAVISAALVILSAGILGYTALFDLFLSIGLFSAWLGIFFPLLFDLAEVTAAVSVFNARLQGEDDKFAWGMVVLFTILGIVANIGHATFAWYAGKITTPQVIVAIFATSLFPLSTALVTHLLKRVIARSIERAAAVVTLAELTGQAAQARADLDKLTGQIERAEARLLDIRSETNREISANVHELNAARQAKIEQRRASVLSLLSSGLAPADIASELNVTVRTVKRDITALNGAAHAARGMAQ